MKILKTPFTLSLILAFFFACTQKESQKIVDSDTSAISENSSEETADNSITQVAFKDSKATEIIQAYLNLKDALVETDGEKVNELAKNLGDLLIDGKYSQPKEETQKIASSTDPKVQRDAFDELSELMISVAKSNELASGNLYVQHCPMANGNQGANWLSLSEEIRNPYFGERMLKCGRVTEELSSL